MPIRFKEVIPNLLYRGGEPKSWEISALKHVFGIEQIISLDEKIGNNISKVCKLNNINHLIIPLTNCTDDAIGIILDNGAKNLVANKPTYVHCRHGKDRTGVFVAIYRIEDGWSCKKAIDEALSFGFGSGLDSDTTQSYIDAITHETGDSISVDDIDAKSNSLCKSCGMLKNNTCKECRIMDGILKLSNVIDADIDTATATSESREEPSAYQGIADDPEVRDVSSMFCVPENTTVASKFRQHIIEYKLKEDLFKKADNQLSFKVPEGEKKVALQAVRLFENLVDGQMKDFSQHIDLMYQPFTDYQGIQPEQALDASVHFSIFDKMMQNKLTTLKSKLLKAMDLLEEFESDHEIETMLSALNSSIATLDKQVARFETVLDDLNTKDFQQNSIRSMDVIKKELAQLKQLIVETVVDYIRTHILDEDWTTSIREEVITEKQEQKR